MTPAPSTTPTIRLRGQWTEAALSALADILLDAAKRRLAERARAAADVSKKQQEQER
jgi:hypothetical protein